MTALTVPELLDASADLIEDEGWTQWMWESPSGGFCVTGAIRRCAGVKGSAFMDSDPVANEALRAMIRYLRQAPTDWNDADGRTKEDVVEALRAAALIEAAKRVDVTVVTPAAVA